MKFVMQRVRSARLDVDGKHHAEIGPGFVILVGFSAEEMTPEPSKATLQAWEQTVNKALGLRVFSDAEGKMNLDLDSIEGHILLVSQFTLYADCRKGRRPSFHTSAPAEKAEKAYDKLVENLRGRLGNRLQTGIFGADMDIHLTNWGPVTILLDSEDFLVTS